jgi:hypothetical protein
MPLISTPCAPSTTSLVTCVMRPMQPFLCPEHCELRNMPSPLRSVSYSPPHVPNAVASVPLTRPAQRPVQ